MQKYLLAIIAVVAGLFPAPTLKADIPDGFEDIHYLVAKVPGLVPIRSDTPTMSSPSAAGRAVTYAEIISRAAKYFERQLGWTLPVRVLVLNKDDWNRISDIPYPAPHIRSTEKLILMPDSLVEFPGFETWGFDDVALNAVLTVHELGHGLAHVNGLNVSDTDASITEIIANMLMAGFILDEMPEMKRLLDGVPNGFSPTEPYQLSDFDYFYVTLGLQNYAYFQFVFAKTAGFMVSHKPISELMPAMVEAFRPGANYLPDANLARLEQIVPGAAASLAGLAGESRVASTAIVSCRDIMPANVHDNSVTLFVENRGTKPVRLRDVVWEKRMEETNLVIAKMLDEEPKKVEPEYFVMPPGRWFDFRVVPGQEMIVGDVGCFQVGTNPVRAVFRD